MLRYTTDMSIRPEGSVSLDRRPSADGTGMGKLLERESDS